MHTPFKRWYVFVGVLLLGALPVVAASEAAHGEGEATPNLFSGDLGNAIWTLVIFVLLVVVLGRFAWGPILATLQKREQFIRESLEEAKRDREQAEKHLNEIEERLRRASEEAGRILEAGRRDAEATKRRTHEQARTEADDMIERARREISIARDAAVKELYQRVADMATDVAGKALSRSLSEDDQKRLIQASLDEIHNQVTGTGAN